MSRKQWAVFLSFALLSGTRWILEDMGGGQVPDVETKILSFAAILVAALAGTSVPWRSLDGIRLRSLLPAGLLLFVVPAVLSLFEGRGLPVLLQVSLLTLVVPGVVLLSSALGVERSDFLGLLGAALAGVAGVLLVLGADPEAMLQRPWAGVIVLLQVVSIAGGSYLAFLGTGGASLRAVMLFVAGPGVLGFLAMAGVRGVRLVAPGWGGLAVAAWDAVTVVLLLSLLRRVPPVKLGTRFLVVPCVTAVEGLLWVRPPLTARFGLGAVLVGFSLWRLLAAEVDREETSLL